MKVTKKAGLILPMARDLTGNEVALAIQGVSHAMNWWKAQPMSGERTKHMTNLRALNKKLNAVSDYAYPYPSSDDMPPEIGEEIIFRLDGQSVRRSRMRAKAAGMRARGQ